MTYVTTMLHKNPCPTVMKFTILAMVDPSLFIITVCSMCLIYAQEWRRRYLKKYINFTHFTHKIFRLVVLDHENSLTYRCYIPNLVNIGQVVLDKMYDRRCQPIAMFVSKHEKTILFCILQFR